MTRAHQSLSWLRLVDLSSTAAGPASAVAVLDEHVSGAFDDDLVSLWSGELSAPLASMVGCAELIDSGDITHDQRHLYAGILLREGRRLRALISNAVALQRLETGHRQLDVSPVDVHSLIQRAVVAAGQDDQRPIAVRVPDQLPMVAADAEAVLKVLTGFLSNARRFSPDGGAIRIEARPAGQMVEICISDHGVGIDTNALPRVFDKSFRADKVRRLAPGAGLGLALYNKIVEAHGGRVEASSKGPGKGARFQFTLPSSRPGDWSAEVLVVDDDPAFANLLKAELAAQGLSAVRAADAETAEHLLACMTPRAIVLDLVLPGLQGEDFLARLEAGGAARVPVVVLSLKDVAPIELSALERAGVLAVLPKEAGAPQAAVALVAQALGLDPVGG